MARVKRGVIARARHKKILKLAKGYYGARSRVFRVAKQAVNGVHGQSTALIHAVIEHIARTRIGNGEVLRLAA